MVLKVMEALEVVIDTVRASLDRHSLEVLGLVTKHFWTALKQRLQQTANTLENAQRTLLDLHTQPPATPNDALMSSLLTSLVVELQCLFVAQLLAESHSSLNLVMGTSSGEDDPRKEMTVYRRVRHLAGELLEALVYFWLYMGNHSPAWLPSPPQPSPSSPSSPPKQQQQQTAGASDPLQHFHGNTLALMTYWRQFQRTLRRRCFPSDALTPDDKTRAAWEAVDRAWRERRQGLSRQVPVVTGAGSLARVVAATRMPPRVLARRRDAWTSTWGCGRSSRPPMPLSTVLGLHRYYQGLHERGAEVRRVAPAVGPVLLDVLCEMCGYLVRWVQKADAIEETTSLFAGIQSGVIKPRHLAWVIPTKRPTPSATRSVTSTVTPSSSSSSDSLDVTIPPPEGPSPHSDDDKAHPAKTTLQHDPDTEWGAVREGEVLQRLPTDVRVLTRFKRDVEHERKLKRLLISVVSLLKINEVDLYKDSSREGRLELWRDGQLNDLEMTTSTETLPSLESIEEGSHSLPDDHLRLAVRGQTEALRELLDAIGHIQRHRLSLQVVFPTEPSVPSSPSHPPAASSAVPTSPTPLDHDESEGDDDSDPEDDETQGTAVRAGSIRAVLSGDVRVAGRDELPECLAAPLFALSDQHLLEIARITSHLDDSDKVEGQTTSVDETGGGLVGDD
ncbi:unnamed protein product [Vitrella brassicaformis CCMP3155]|uniref:Uncharacterized protein n=2 Tax=Vitrella brassicaformis TaxID=1169539 RepID=A0A0G4FJB5_VITBC|nr:unnamed protein product [Vitrella brassicaformis CCMP3155]|eukprot:CEM13689.1 unnamed protein product [Vitrella brassicaformis CCMP3155]